MLLKHNEVHPSNVGNGDTTVFPNGDQYNGVSSTADREKTTDSAPPSVTSKEDRRCSEETGEDILNIPLANSGFQKFLPRFLRYKFADKSLEALYMVYFGHQRRQMLQTTLVLSVILDLAFLLQYGLEFTEERIAPIAVISTFLFVNLLLAVLTTFSLLPERVLRPLPYIVWVCLAVQIYSDIGFGQPPYSASVSVGWQLLYIFSSYVWLPVGLSWCLIINFLSPCIFTLLVGLLSATDNYSVFKIGNQVRIRILYRKAPFRRAIATPVQAGLIILPCNTCIIRNQLAHKTSLQR